MAAILDYAMAACLCLLATFSQRCQTVYDQFMFGAFTSNVCSLVATFEELGNQFLDHSKDLVTIDTQEISRQAVVETVGKIHLRGANLVP